MGGLLLRLGRRCLSCGGRLLGLLQLLVSIIQAFVFTLLVLIYLSMAVAHEH